MKVSIRRKIILSFTGLMVLNGLIWFLGYYDLFVVNRKLQVIERKDNLFNVILEARRYEKNYFMSLDPANLRQAVSYASQAEEKLGRIIKEHGPYVLAKDVSKQLALLEEYRADLSQAAESHEGNPSTLQTADFLSSFEGRKQAISGVGKKITDQMEYMIGQERYLVKQLIRRSQIYFFVALGAILAVSVFTYFFLRFNVIRPMRRIEKGIVNIGEGHYESIPWKATGDEFESLVESLNKMVNELHRRSEQIVQSKKMASLGTLTSGVAHELNNPLNNIYTSVQILLEEIDEGNIGYQKELLKETEKQIERARDIVKALLEFSRERSFNPLPVRILELVENTIKLIKGELPANVEVKVDVPDDITATLDSRRIQQVLLNLAMNGVQAMEGGGILQIRAFRTSGPDGSLCIQVMDTGKGIPPEHLAKIFDPFFSTKEVGKGTGLGLSVAHGIVEQHGGRIEVDSQVGEGSTFSIYLPLSAPRPDGN